jgi:hypothetical protein
MKKEGKLQTAKQQALNIPIVSNHKSFYDKDGYVLNEDGLVASKQMKEAISRIYCEWMDKGFSPYECREMLLTQVWTISTFENAIRSCE